MRRPTDGNRAAPPVGVPDPAGVDPAVLGTLLGRHGWLRRGGSTTSTLSSPSRTPGTTDDPAHRDRRRGT
ncbi:hypothetical protein ACWC5G_35765, partial [Streptomyces sp. NPDC001274]